MLRKIVQKLKSIFIPCKDNNYRPKLLDSNFLFYYALIILILKLVILPFFLYLPRASFFAALTKETLISMTNQERQSLGFNTLKENLSLDKAAYQKAQDMLKLGYFSHQSPQGKSPWFWFDKSGYRYQKAGENLAIGFLESEEVFRAWNNSPSHKKNIIDPGYKDTGVAVLKGNFRGKEVTIVVQLFGSRLTPFTPIQKIKAQGEVKKPKAEEKIKQKSLAPATASAEKVKDSQAPIVLSTRTAKGNQTSGFIRFMAIDYPGLIEKVVLYSLITIIVILSFTILVEINIQHRDLIAKALLFVFVFVSFLFLNKEVLLEWIPHSLTIK